MNDDFSLCLNNAEFTFSANHFITFDNGFTEPLHGHNFQICMNIRGKITTSGYLLDFLEAEKFLRQIVEDWNHKTLLAVNNPYLKCKEDNNQVVIQYQGPGEPLVWSLPAEHCCSLPIVNTTTELLAWIIAKKFGAFLKRNNTSDIIDNISEWEVILTEATGCSAGSRMQKEA